MNFKEMQLVGFKSFADKTHMAFDPVLTVVVGPNGSRRHRGAPSAFLLRGDPRIR